MQPPTSQRLLSVLLEELPRSDCLAKETELIGLRRYVALERADTAILSNRVTDALGSIRLPRDPEKPPTEYRHSR